MKVLFVDFDGTLVDSVPKLYQVYLGFLKDHGVTGTADEFQSLNGATIPQFVERFMQRYRLTGVQDAMTNDYYDRVAHAYDDGLALFPGAERVIRAVKAQGIRMAVVTASQHELVKQVLRIHGIDDLFEHIVTSVGLKASKPDPAIYHRALSAMHSTAEDALAIEDSPHGVTAAQAAGIPTIAFGQRWESQSGNVNFVQDWNELAKYLSLGWQLSDD